jgi:hypothetical protein
VRHQPRSILGPARPARASDHDRRPRPESGLGRDAQLAIERGRVTREAQGSLRQSLSVHATLRQASPSWSHGLAAVTQAHNRFRSGNPTNEGGMSCRPKSQNVFSASRRFSHAPGSAVQRSIGWLIEAASRKRCRSVNVASDGGIPKSGPGNGRREAKRRLAAAADAGQPIEPLQPGRRGQKVDAP